MVPAVLWLEATNTRRQGRATRGGQYAENQATVSRRPRRQHPAHARDQGGAGEAREGRDQRADLKEGRGPGNPEGHQEAGGGRAARPRPTASIRRSWWHFDFYGMPRQRRNLRARPRHPVPGRADQAALRQVTGKIGFSNHPMLEHFKFVKQHTKLMPKMCIPSPTCCISGSSRTQSSKSVYADRDAIFADLRRPISKAVKAFYDAGCRYLQFDDTAWAYLCSQVEMKKATRARHRRRPSAGDLHPRASTRRSRPSPPT